MKLMDLDLEQLGIPVSNRLLVVTFMSALCLTCSVCSPFRSKSTAAWWRCPPGNLPVSAVTYLRLGMRWWSPVPRMESSSPRRENWVRETSNFLRPAPLTKKMRRWVDWCCLLVLIGTNTQKKHSLTAWNYQKVCFRPSFNAVLASSDICHNFLSLCVGHNWDERTGSADFCPQLSQLLYQGHAAV